MTLKDFAKIKSGTVVMLYYNCSNKGDMQWKHSHVEGDRVHGQFYASTDWPFAGADGWSAVGDYLYEFEGLVCRGSGAEPVFRTEQEADEYREQLV